MLTCDICKFDDSETDATHIIMHQGLPTHLCREHAARYEEAFPLSEWPEYEQAAEALDRLENES